MFNSSYNSYYVSMSASNYLHSDLYYYNKHRFIVINDKLTLGCSIL